MSKPMSEQMQKLADKMDKHCRICHNTSCSNHGKNISFLGDGWKCNYIPVPTNADRIRAMSDEELANIVECPYGNPYFDEHLPCRGSCHDCLLIWLQQPAEEEDDYEF